MPSKEMLYVLNESQEQISENVSKRIEHIWETLVNSISQDQADSIIAIFASGDKEEIDILVNGFIEIYGG